MQIVRAPVSGISVRTDWTGRDVRFGTKEVVEVSKSSKARASRIPMVIPSHPVSLSLSLSPHPIHHLIPPVRPSIHPIRPPSSLTSQPTQAPRTPPPLPQRLPPPSRRAVVPTSLLFLIVLFPSESNAKARYAGISPCPCNLGWTRLNFRRLLTYVVRSIHKYQQLPHHTFFSQLTLSLATFAFATFWCSSDLALGTRDISYRFSQQTGIPIDCRRKVWPCRGLVRRLVVHDPSGRHAWTPWTLDLVFLAVFWPRAAGHSLVPDAAKKDLALSVGHPHFACLRFFSQNVRDIHLPYPRAVLFVLPLPILSRYGSCHPS
ncbi:hypothetical protein CTAM01_05953 [Colletotrichum tamarilloi]|uniref:Uncharacterized protein n=1 Tax=Colletotrichum tamarilloi TaxID=1209934 RepID=A0ABQ9RD57_9PEZI|nr:uncharacterized protein CTAM01_05953 [Colletotrichum tamarilloi]KAK1501228.1 hypothetical protein CTAM01_05953 [Colletotrichum tamarilloi]